MILWWIAVMRCSLFIMLLREVGAIPPRTHMLNFKSFLGIALPTLGAQIPLCLEERSQRARLSVTKWGAGPFFFHQSSETVFFRGILCFWCWSKGWRKRKSEARTAQWKVAAGISLIPFSSSPLSSHFRACCLNSERSPNPKLLLTFLLSSFNVYQREEAMPHMWNIQIRGSLLAWCLCFTIL